MSPIEVARKLAGFGKTEEACRAYVLALAAIPGPDPDEKMEAAMYILQFEGEYRAAYTAFLELYRDGHYKEDAWNIMTEAFYLPNEKLLRSRYENNVKQLRKYPYLFRNDFPEFEELPIKFYPFDDSSYVPYDAGAERFEDMMDPGEQVIHRNFFKNLENPLLAEDVYSQYELEYLNDNVRHSEYVGRENHIYLHYKSWEEFCSYLQVLNFRKLLIDKKLVFLIEDEISRYPIDFKAEYGIDYSTFPLKPVGIREINRLIWHTQLSYHNGGDFFNEVFDGHPNILSYMPVMNEDMEKTMEDLRATLDDARSVQEIMEVFNNGEWDNLDMIRELFLMRDRTDKDIMVAICFRSKMYLNTLDPAARIVPAIFFQPHFGYNHVLLRGDDMGRAVMSSEQYETVRKSAVFRKFKYIKSFTPMRRITTSYGASVRFMWGSHQGSLDTGKILPVADEIVDRLLLRGYLVDEEQRALRDGVIVRFEDAKLNPDATFHALAEFLDVPYAESMTKCTLMGVTTNAMLDQEVYGFDTAAVYKTYDEFCCDAERCWLEYFLRDAYEYYGYNFKYYDGGPVDEERVLGWLEHFDKIDYYLLEINRAYHIDAVKKLRKEKAEAGEAVEYTATVEEEAEESLAEFMQIVKDRRERLARILLKGLKFVNEQGRPLKFMPKLELDPALLEQPLYH